MNWKPDEDFKGLLSVDFFDDLMNHLDCPPDEEDVDTINGEGDWVAKFQELEPPPMDMFSSLPSELASFNNGKGGRVETQKTVPASKQSISSEVLSGVNNTLQQSSLPPDNKVSKLFQSLSPVSVLENICGSLAPQNAKSRRLAFPVKRMRSKRKRPTHPTTMKLSYLFPFEPKKPEKLNLGETKRKNQLKTHTMSSSFEASNPNMISRKCTHCETTKTPQWREGPSGPKTLCNACGVRYRSGRLVPEYRPASSPTFIPSLHSNSHRKIIEMKRKDNNLFDTSMTHGVTSKARARSVLSLVSDPQNGNSMEEEADGVKVGS